VRLSFAEAVGYLGVSETTARRWIRDRGLPVHRADERLFLNPVELWEWAVEHHVPVSPELLEREKRTREAVAPISALLAAGGIHHDVPDGQPVEVLRAVVDRLPLPPHVERSFLATALAAREAMGSTGVGYGIAIPHVRNPILLQVKEPTVSLCLLRQSVDFGAIDGQPVHALFTVISPTVPTHLRILAALSLLLHDEELRRLLQDRAPAASIFERIHALERAPRAAGHPGGAAPAGGGK
jgi:PTS system nitrogen regulatory IIA component